MAYYFKYTPAVINGLSLSEFDVLAAAADELAKDAMAGIDH